MEAAGMVPCAGKGLWGVTGQQILELDGLDGMQVLECVGGGANAEDIACKRSLSTTQHA
jgi:hypothetical protein